MSWTAALHWCQADLTGRVFLLLLVTYLLLCWLQDCSILLEDTNFFEFEGEPYCERHYHERMCPDCIKMRRALARYCGRETTSGRPAGSQQAFRTLNLPPRPSSRQSIEQKMYVHEIQKSSSKSHLNVPSVTVNDDGRPISSQSQYSMESTYKEERNNTTNGSHVSPYGSEYSTVVRTPTPLQSWSNSNNNSSSGFTAQDKQSHKEVSSGKFPVGPNREYQFEATFEKKEYQAISRH